MDDLSSSTHRRTTGSTEALRDARGSREHAGARGRARSADELSADARTLPKTLHASAIARENALSAVADARALDSKRGMRTSGTATCTCVA
eukprot:4670830-Pleurochrysis_carterae.AAC.2